MSPADDARAELLWSGTDDWVSLAEAADIVRNDRSVAPATLKAETLRVVADLLDDGLVRVGEVSGGFRPWGLDNRDTIEEIDRRWSEPYEDIAPADGIWLANTPEGDALAQGLADRGAPPASP